MNKNTQFIKKVLLAALLLGGSGCAETLAILGGIGEGATKAEAQEAERKLHDAKMKLIEAKIQSIREGRSTDPVCPYDDLPAIMTGQLRSEINGTFWLYKCPLDHHFWAKD